MDNMADPHQTTPGNSELKIEQNQNQIFGCFKIFLTSRR